MTVGDDGPGRPRRAVAGRPDGGGLTLQWRVGAPGPPAATGGLAVAPLVLGPTLRRRAPGRAPSGLLRDYAGSVTTRTWGSGARSINTAGAEAHIRSVVPVEMPASWPSAALQAQAIAARSYAAYGRAHAPRRTTTRVTRRAARSTAGSPTTTRRNVAHVLARLAFDRGHHRHGRQGRSLRRGACPDRVLRVERRARWSAGRCPTRWPRSTPTTGPRSRAHPQLGPIGRGVPPPGRVPVDGQPLLGSRPRPLRVAATGADGRPRCGSRLDRFGDGERLVVRGGRGTTGHLVGRDLTAGDLQPSPASRPHGRLAGRRAHAERHGGGRPGVLRQPRLRPEEPSSDPGFAGTSLLTGVGPFDADNLGDVVARRSDGSLWLWSG